MSELLTNRGMARERAEYCDGVIEQWDQVAHLSNIEVNGRPVPPMEASPEQVALTATAEITVSAEWLAYMLEFVAAWTRIDVQAKQGGAS